MKDIQGVKVRHPTKKAAICRKWWNLCQTVFTLEGGMMALKHEIPNRLILFCIKINMVWQFSVGARLHFSLSTRNRLVQMMVDMFDHAGRHKCGDRLVLITFNCSFGAGSQFLGMKCSPQWTRHKLRQTNFSSGSSSPNGSVGSRLGWPCWSHEWQVSPTNLLHWWWHLSWSCKC